MRTPRGVGEVGDRRRNILALGDLGFGAWQVLQKLIGANGLPTSSDLRRERAGQVAG